MNSTARGLIRPDGREPALNASTVPAPWMRAKASAIWLRLLFSTQTKTMRFMSCFLRTRRAGAAARRLDAAAGQHAGTGAQGRGDEVDPEVVEVHRHQRRGQRPRRVHRRPGDGPGEQRL